MSFLYCRRISLPCSLLRLATMYLLSIALSGLCRLTYLLCRSIRQYAVSETSCGTSVHPLVPLSVPRPCGCASGSKADVCRASSTHRSRALNRACRIASSAIRSFGQCATVIVGLHKWGGVNLQLAYSSEVGSIRLKRPYVPLRHQLEFD